MRRVAFALIAVALAACESRVAGDSAPGLVCRHAGGQCRLGGVACASSANESADDCNPDLDTAGSFCCLDVQDAGAADASARTGAACVAASGHCILAGFSCVSVAADAVQDCVNDSAFCCLAADAGVY